MNHIRQASLKVLLVIPFLISCSGNDNQNNSKVPISAPQEQRKEKKEENTNQESNLVAKLTAKYGGAKPTEWGEAIGGVRRRLDTSEKVIALTFDACGGPHGSAYDSDIIVYLQQKHIPATLFLNSRWIDANTNTFMSLAKSPQFEIENHGYLHKPLSIDGRSAWGIKGTVGISEMVDEVQMNHQKILQLTGRAPKFFRSGTAFYDDIGVKVVTELGELPVNYNVLGDAGATFTKEQVRTALLSSKPGSIVILHMNQPQGETAEGLKLAIPDLLKQGYRFVTLSEYPLK